MKDQYRIIIWGLGQVGRPALQLIDSRQSLTLVGAYDLDPAKVGRNAGEVCGFAKTGVIVSGDEVLGLDADIVLYYPSTKWDEGKLPSPTSVGGNVEDIVKILSHGKNCSSTLPVYFSEKNAPEYFRQIDEAAKRSGVTYTQQGIFPGLFTPYFPSISGMFSRRIDTAIVYGGEDDAVNSAPWISVFGYGKRPEEVSAERLAVVKNIMFTYYGPTVIEMAERLGLEYDEYSCEEETILSKEEVTTPYTHVTPGTVGAHRFVMCTKRDGREVTGFHFVHKASSKTMRDLPLDTYVEIKGEPDLTVRLENIIPDDDPFLTSAAPNVNLIPAIVDAEPGYQDALDIPFGRVPR
ncbi:hypothetical protein HMPREF1008_01679 [Olsenella sp. oral taxon 809 str. F0356]|uniref:hypothetical protein n=1 Tax=Olsenella sp. oral taxon 809 TaxID=661086 RepID=UPI000231F227|nr:hypothetical protein [Olsenella sp. oral taxon 809]EHF01199.1 hypothetical protein HMPREF1008_01679 [Olsenella sp. oral taxon 809 str. F0356]